MTSIAIRPISSFLKNLKLYHSQQLLKQATRKNVIMFRILQKPMLQPLMITRNFSTNNTLLSSNEVEDDVEDKDEEEDGELDSDKQFVLKYLDPKDRSRVIPPEISMKYMESVAFATTYGNDPIWKKYRRNFGVSNWSNLL